MNNKILLFLLVVSFLPLHSICAQVLEKGAPEQVGMDSGRLQNLTRVLQQYVDQKQLSGAVALVARKNKIVYFEAIGAGDLEDNRSMEKDAIFRIASQTKAIVSVGIMILQEEGKLLISDPVGKYIPAFGETQVAVGQENGGYRIEMSKRPITIRDLLTHTAGIGYGEGRCRSMEKSRYSGVVLCSSGRAYIGYCRAYGSIAL